MYAGAGALRGQVEEGGVDVAAAADRVELVDAAE